MINSAIRASAKPSKPYEDYPFGWRWSSGGGNRLPTFKMILDGKPV